MEIPEVMKPKRLDDISRLDRLDEDHYTVEPKWDGYRTLLVKDEYGTVRAYSRLHNEKTKNIPHIVKDMDILLPRGTIIDGEIIFPTEDEFVSDFTKVKMIMGSQYPAALEKQAIMGLVQYKAFDILFYRGKDCRDLPLMERRHFLQTALLESIPTVPRVSSQRVKDLMTHGRMEGVVIKNLHGRYVSGKRPVNNWYKVKMTDSIDAVVMGFNPPDQFNDRGEETWIYRAGLIGAVVFGQYKDGKLVRRGQTSGMNVQVRGHMTKHQEQYLGKVIEVQHMGLTDKAVRHPQYKGLRDDKSPQECTWDY